jgi:hypothetical protein
VRLSAKAKFKSSTIATEKTKNMEEQKENNPKQENQKSPDKKSLSGTESEKEKSLLEKASETIAGDNQLMASVMKFLLSPVSLLVCAGIVIYCFFKINGQKKEIEELKKENRKLTDEKNETQEDHDKIKKKYKKLKALNEEEEQKSVAGFTPLRALSEDPQKKKTYNSAYLD